MNKYDPKIIEPKWQKFWEDNKTFAAKEDAKKEKFFGLVEFPYPSGAGLHVGHPRSYTAMDVITRKKRMEGKSVLFPIGFDSFGLPTENFAIKTSRPPQEITDENIANFTRQLKALGFGFDWDRAVTTSEPEYYKWTQWIFLQLFKHGLAYKTNQPINWCPKDKIGLANEEVVDGCCERCGNPVEKRNKEQWMLAITKYADKLLAGLNDVDYISRAKTQQENWIGRSEGAEINFPIKYSEQKINFLILHGRNGSPDSHTFPWWKKQLETKGYRVQVPSLPHADEPNDDEQAEFVFKNCVIDENTIILGHSFGGIVALRLAERGIKVKKIILLCTPFSGNFLDNKSRPSVTAACQKGFNFEKIVANTKEFKLIYDISDYVVPLSDGQSFAKKLNVDLTTIKCHGPHACGETEPEVLNLLFDTIKVFTTRPDTIFGVTFLAVSAEWAEKWFEKRETSKGIKEYIATTLQGRTTAVAREEVEKTGINSGIVAVNPVSGDEVPVWIVNYVLADVGTGAIMAVPAHDERDFEFAQKFGLPVKEVVIKQLGERIENSNKRRSVRGICVRDGKMLVTLDKIMQEYILPGGGIEAGESASQALLREIREETGYKNIVLKECLGTVEHNYFHIYHKNNWQSIVTSYVFEIIGDEVVERLPKEIEKTDIYWLPYLEAKNNMLHSARTFTREVEFFDRFETKRGIPFCEDGISINSDFLNELTTHEAKEKIISFLEEKGIGKRQTNFKLRDWVFSRQRYWGEPIPLVYCEKCAGWIPIPEDQLPLTLPKVEKYLPTDNGESPLAPMTDWVNTTCPQCGGPARRETDTMPNWAGSSWYWLRYMDPHNSVALADRKKMEYWAPVDWYNGGMEHTVLHLLYSRFWNQFLYDIGVVPTLEPYKKRTSHGMILASDGQKMSKSLGNVVNPDEMVAQFGADALRAYILFMGPFDQPVAWDTNGLIGVRRFLDRVWNLQEKVIDTTNNSTLQTFLHQTIKKVTEDIENMRFNTAIAKLMELSNEMSKEEKIAQEDYQLFIQLLAPFTPHIAEELWIATGGKGSVAHASWPEYDAELAKESQITVVAQINGKVRDEFVVSPEISEEEIKQLVLSSEKIQKWLEGREPKKIIYVKGRLVSIVI